MKKTFLTLYFCLLSYIYSYGQNTYPTNGYVGIGTTSPQTSLEVMPPSRNAPAGLFHLSGGQSWGHVLTLATDNSTADDARLLLSYRNNSKRWAIGGQSNTTRFSIWEDAGDGVYGGGWGNERFTVNEGGNVGIGTSTPAYKFDVNGDMSGNMLRAGSLFSLQQSGKRWDINYEANGNYFFVDEFGLGRHLAIQGGSGNVGIGTPNPTNRLTVNAGENNKSIEISGNNFFESPYTHNFPALSFYSTQSAVRQPNASAEMVFADRPGTAGYPQNARASDILFYTAHSYDGPSNSYGVFPDLTMVVKSTQDGGLVGIGTTNPDAAYKLSVNGNIRSKEVKVETGWADYVFKKDYQLPSLKEVDAYIQANQHLPEVPSEAEVKKNGVNVGETEALLLKKIEELTLYLIEKDKELKAQTHKVDIQSEQLKSQSDKNHDLELRLSKLELLLMKPSNKE